MKNLMGGGGGGANKEHYDRGVVQEAYSKFCEGQTRCIVGRGCAIGE